MITNDIIYAVRPDGTIEFDTPDGITARSGTTRAPIPGLATEGTVEESWAEWNGMHGRFSG